MTVIGSNPPPQAAIAMVQTLHVSYRYPFPQLGTMLLLVLLLHGIDSGNDVISALLMQILDDCMERVYAEAQQRWSEEAERRKQAAETERQAERKRRAAEKARAEAARCAAAAEQERQEAAIRQSKPRKDAAAAQDPDLSHQKGSRSNTGAFSSGNGPNMHQQTAPGEAAASILAPESLASNKRKPDDRLISPSKRQTIQRPESAAPQPILNSTQSESPHPAQGDLAGSAHAGGLLQPQPGSATKRVRSEDGHNEQGSLPKKQLRRKLVIPEEDEDEEEEGSLPERMPGQPSADNAKLTEGLQPVQPEVPQPSSHANATQTSLPQSPAQDHLQPSQESGEYQRSSQDAPQQRTGPQLREHVSQDTSGQAAMNVEGEALACDGSGEGTATEEGAAQPGSGADQRRGRGRRGRGRGRGRGRSSGMLTAPDLSWNKQACVGSRTCIPSKASSYLSIEEHVMENIQLASHACQAIAKSSYAKP